MMVGNDIVDLTDPPNQSKSRDRRFLDRVFSASEQSQILQASEPDRQLWQFWAAKEAAFKVMARQVATSIFSPIRFQVEASSPIEGVVRWADHVWPVAWAHDANWVHAWVWQTSSSDVWLDSAVQPCGGVGDSRAVRALACERLALCGWPEAEIRDRPPQAWQIDRLLPVSVSLSHDGAYAAVALLTIASADGLESAFGSDSKLASD